MVDCWWRLSRLKFHSPDILLIHILGVATHRFRKCYVRNLSKVEVFVVVCRRAFDTWSNPSNLERYIRNIEYVSISFGFPSCFYEKGAQVEMSAYYYIVYKLFLLFKFLNSINAKWCLLCASRMSPFPF